MEKERLQIVMSELIELQWEAKGRLNGVSKFDIYEDMIKQVRKLQLGQIK